MHGCSSESPVVVNAEVDSMGGVVNSGVGIDTKTSPRQEAIEKAQAELRQEYDVREERRRELEFLQKGGNPLDFKFGNTVSVSVQSTSLTDQHPEQFITSEAKGSFALTASPRGDSVESSGRPGVPTGCEPNSADNLLLFDVESEFHEGERNSIQLSRTNLGPSERAAMLDGSQKAKESGGSGAFGIPKNQAYRRRNRSRPNRDGSRSSSTDIIPSRGGHTNSLPSRHVPKDAKGPGSETNNQKDQNIFSVRNTKLSSPNDSVVLKARPPNGRLDMELDGVRVVEPVIALTRADPPEVASDINVLKNVGDNQHHQMPQNDIQETHISMTSDETGFVGVGEREQEISANHECSLADVAKVENQTDLGQSARFSNSKGDTKNIPNECENNSNAFSMKCLDAESSCTRTSLSVDGNNDSDLCTNFRNMDSNGTNKEQMTVFNGTPNVEVNEMVKETSETKVNDHCALFNNNSSLSKAGEELHDNGSDLKKEVHKPTSVKGIELDGFTTFEKGRKQNNLFGDNNDHTETACTGRVQASVDSPGHNLPEITLPIRGSAAVVAPEQPTSSATHFLMANKAHEDSILEEARVIEAKRKRIAELSVGTLPLEHRQRSQWDFVLEEMSWLANDFAQERLWKLSAAAQICHQVAFASRLRFEGQSLFREQKEKAHTLAKAVMQFWHSAKERSKEPDLHSPGKNSVHAVQEYAVKFLKYNGYSTPISLAEAPVTLDRISDIGNLEMSWEDRLTEENLFYVVHPGAMEAYRKSIESLLAQSEKTRNNMQEEVETSMYDAIADNGFLENGYEEDEEESTYFIPGASEGSKSSKFSQRKRKNLMKSYAARSYELGADSVFPHCLENKFGKQQSVLVGKRSAHSLNVGSIPTKRVRTAPRSRVPCPFTAGTSGFVQASNKTDASSGDTNSFQDDHSTLNGGSQIPNSWEVESAGNFEKQVPTDSVEVSTKVKKKKKAKYLGSTYEQRWQLDSNFQNEQRDHSRKRLESHQLESNGSSGLFGQHIGKKPKMMKQSVENSFESLTPMAGSIPSPAASQMSNMSNPNKFIKMLGVRDRGRKGKLLKMPAGAPGSGCPWSLFEDQALVVLVHDMGPNWELVSDAINSTLQFKCIFRKPKECKERHKILMDRTAGDGADSAEDSGSSQPYPSTLPGIPKGSARQLFQRLQGPMEEDTLKSHFEKIIVIGQKLHYRRTQKNDNQDIKQIQPHNSHAAALSQVSPNNLNGGPPLTPHDLCDATASSPDANSLGYQGSQTGGLAISNQGTVASMLSASGANSSPQGSSSMVLSSNYSSPSGSLNASIRDGRYGVPRTGSLPMDEQKRVQQHNQMLSGRNIQQNNLPVPGVIPGTDRGVRIPPGGNGMAIMCGANRSSPMARPGFQGIASSPVLNSGNMLSSSMVGMPSTVNMHAGTGQGNSMLRPRDALHMMRTQEHQRQMMVPDLQMQQVTQTNSQGVPGFVSSSFPNQAVPPPAQTYPLHQQQHQSHVLSSPHHPHLQGPPNHVTSNQHHQAFAIRYAKERHLQQRMLHQQHQQQQQQQQFAASNGLMQHVQAQPQLPISPSLQNSSQIQTQTSSPPVSLSPLTMTPMPPQHQQQKHHIPPHGLNRNSQAGVSGLNNQMGKQRQRQPQQLQQQFQPPGRHHPQQRPQSQSQQQAKMLKGVGRGNVLMHQNLPIDASLMNGLSTTIGSQSAEKGEQGMHLMQGQGPYSGSKPLLLTHSANHSQPQQQMYSGQTIPSLKQLQQVPSHSDNGKQGHVPSVNCGPAISASRQAAPSAGMPLSNHQQLQQQPRQNLVNQTQPTGPRVLQQNRQMSSDSLSKLQVDHGIDDQQTVRNSCQMSNSTATPKTCTDTSNVAPIVSSAGNPQRKAPEQLYDSGIPNSAIHLVPVGNLTDSAGSECMPPVSQGLGQRQSSSSLPSIGHNVGTQWRQQQQQQSLLQPPPTSSTPPPQQHQQQQSPSQLPPQQQSQQQTQHLQAGNNGLYIRQSNSRTE